MTNTIHATTTTRAVERQAAIARLQDALTERTENLETARARRATAMAESVGDGMTRSDPAAFRAALEGMQS